MRRTSALALGLALSLGAGLAPLATAAATPAAPASDAPGGLAARLGSMQRETGATRAPSPAGKASGIAAALPPTGQYFRLSGANRYATAVAVSQDLVCGPTETSAQCSGLGGVDAPVDVVFVASGVNYPDALGPGRWPPASDRSSWCRRPAPFLPWWPTRSTGSTPPTSSSSAAPGQSARASRTSSRPTAPCRGSPHQPLRHGEPDRTDERRHPATAGPER